MLQSVPERHFRNLYIWCLTLQIMTVRNEGFGLLFLLTLHLEHSQYSNLHFLSSKQSSVQFKAIPQTEWCPISHNASSVTVRIIIPEVFIFHNSAGEIQTKQYSANPPLLAPQTYSAKFARPANISGEKAETIEYNPRSHTSTVLGPDYISTTKEDCTTVKTWSFEGEHWISRHWFLEHHISLIIGINDWVWALIFSGLI